MVTGCLRISIKHEITFMFGSQGSENSSQRDDPVGESCRLILSSIVCRAMGELLYRRIFANVV